MIFCCCRCCRKKEAFPVLSAEDLAPPGPQFVQLCHLQPRKSVCTAYFLWGCFGLFGAHHYYLGRLVHGLAATWTLNFVGVGWLLDGLLLSCYARGFNRSRV